MPPATIRLRQFIPVLVVLAIAACGGGDPAPGGPTVVTGASSAITASGARLDGQANPNGLATSAWFEWGTDPALATCSGTPPQAIGSGSSDAAVSADLGGLAGATTYYFRLCASSAGGTSRGAIRSLATLDPALAPGVRTDAGSGIGVDNAGLAGEVVPNGLATQAWFEWGSDNALAGAAATVRQDVGDGAAGVPITASITGLLERRNYYFRVVGANAAGETRGAIRSFRTALRPCVDCHGGDDGYGTVVNQAPVVTRYWTSSGHGRFSTSAPRAVRAVTCDDCHDVDYLAAADHKGDGSAGATDPPSSINTLTWPGRTLTADRAPTANTAHLKASFFSASPARKADYALAVDRMCGATGTGCHPAIERSHVGRIHPFGDNALAFGRTHGGTPPAPKQYAWYPPSANAYDYRIRFYESPAVWVVDDLTTLAADPAFPDNQVAYGGCVSCHDPHGSGAPVNTAAGVTTNRMMRGDFRDTRTCNTVCHGN
jgi:cytochrome c553